MTATRTKTETTTVTAGDVRRVLQLTTQEITTVCGAASRASRDFDEDRALIHCSHFVLNGIISAIHLQIYLDRELVREYTFAIVDQPLRSFGPPASRPPLGPVPAGARIRLTVTPNERVSAELREGWFRRLGWSDAEPLRMPDAEPRTYGTYVSGGFGVERRLLANPKFDRPLDSNPRKEHQR